MTKLRFVWWLVALAVLRIAMVAAAVTGSPEAGHYAGWYVYHGDEDEYVRVALALARGELVDSFRPIGFPLLLVPFVWWTGATSLAELAGPVVLFHGGVLGPLTVWLVLWLTWRWTGRRTTAVLAAAAWTLLPYLVYWLIHTRPGSVSDVPLQRLAHQLWIQVLSDPPSTFLVVAALMLVTRSWDRPGWHWPVLAGAAAGLAALVRLPNVVLVLGTWWYGWQRRWWSAVWFLLAWGGVVALQAAVNWSVLGAPWRFSGWALEAQRSAELSQAAGYPITLFAWSNLGFISRQLMAKVPPLIWALAAATLLMAAIGWRRLLRRQPQAGWLCLLWSVPLAVLYGINQDFHVSVLHFLMPVLPIVSICGAIALDPELSG